MSKNTLPCIFSALLISAAWALPRPANSAPLVIDDVQGYYSAPSGCTLAGKSCKKKFKDCLLIKKIDQKSAEVEVFSTQANQHICAAKGVAKVIDGKLVLYFDAETGAAVQHLSFIPQGKGMVIEYKVPAGGEKMNCAPHASFDGLAFKKTSNNTNGRQCFEG
jgi:hypothetical protein